MPPRLSVYIRFLHKEQNMGIAKICKMFPEYPKGTLYVHMKKDLMQEHCDKRKNNTGRPRKTNDRDERKIVQTLKKLRSTVGTFTSTDIQNMSGFDQQISNRSVRRVLNKHGYGYYQCRKKGMLSREDLQKRLQFARKCKKLPADFWTEGLSFYLDGTGWVHKTDPCLNAMTHRTRTWRQRGEGLSRECTAKGRKEGTGGKMAKFMVAIAHGRGVIECYQYEGNVNGEMFSTFIKERFPSIFDKGNNKKGKLFLQDGDPSQNCRMSLDAMNKIPCRLFHIPPRSPDLNPIENIFHLVGKKLRKDAKDKNIKKETFNEFSFRVKQTLLNFPSEIIDKTIASMPKRINDVIKMKGHRTKY